MVNVSLFFFCSVKIKNIERTEEAKLKLVQELSKKKDKSASFVASNMAVNYVQHKRCKVSKICFMCHRSFPSASLTLS